MAFTFQIFLFAFCIIVTMQLGFLLIFIFKKKYRLPVTEAGARPCSVIICAKNESENLNKFLPAFLQQQYKGQWELVLVNDASTDNTSIILDKFAREYPQLKVVHIHPGDARDLPGKKYALKRGLAVANYDYVLLSDADCYPASDQWLASMMTGAAGDIVLGYGAYETRSGLLNKFIRWETVHTCMQYVSLADIGAAYMGVGRNLLYKKERVLQLENDPAFLQVYRTTPSGDDDLVISRIATGNNTTACLLPEAKTISVPPDTYANWWRQKTRHVSTGKYYTMPVKILLGMYALSHSLFWILSLAGIALLLYNGAGKPAWLLFGIIFGIRLLLYWIVAAIWYRRLDEKQMMAFYPLGDIGWCIYNVILSPYIFWKNKSTWK